MKDRIKKIRRQLDLTQQEFAERIGIKRNTIANYETGRNDPVDSVISLICREFDVNEEWLRTGEGEMLNPKPSDILDQLACKYKLFSFDYVMIEKFLAMPPDMRRAIYDYFHEVEAALSDVDPYAPAYTGTEPPQPMDKIMESIKSRKNKNVSLEKVSGQTEVENEPTIEELEEKYKKSRSVSASKTDLSASNTTKGNRENIRA